MKKGKSHKTGVVYLSSIPRTMTAVDLKRVLSDLDFLIGRIFLVPESEARRKARKARGGNMKKQVYVEGWVEMLRKRDAKLAGEMLNGRSVGGKEAFSNDLWAMRYLRGFKFDRLEEEEVYKAALHKKQVTQRLNEAKTDTKAYMERVAEAKRVARQREQKRLRGEEFVERPRTLKPQERLHQEKEGVSESLKQSIMQPEVAAEKKHKKKKKHN